MPSDLTKVSALMTEYRRSAGGYQRTIAAKLGEWLSVKDVGALGNGSADDIQAFGDVLEELGANGGEIYIPEGIYCLSEQWVIGELAKRNVRIIGEGIGITRLRFTGSTKGIRFHGGEAGVDWKQLAISGVTLELDGVTGGTGIDARWVNLGGSVAPSAIIDHVEINGPWSTGIYLYDAKQCRVRNAQILGSPGDITQMAAAINLRSNDASSTDDGAGGDTPYGYASDMVVDGCTVSWASTAVLVDQGTGVWGTGPEGVLISNCHMAAVNVGVRSDTQATEPMLNVMNNHVAARAFCVDIEHHNSSIVGNCFYQIADSAFDCTGVNVRSSANGISIIGNTFNGEAAGAHGSNVNGQGSGGKYFNGVAVSSGAHNIVVSGNCFSRVYTAIWWQEGSARCTSNANSFYAIGNQQVLNSAATVSAETFTDRNVALERTRTAMMTLGTNQTIADATYVTAALDTVRWDTGSIASTVGHSVTVPQGATLARVSAQATLDGISTTRLVAAHIFKNGVRDYPGGAGHSITTDSGTQSTYGEYVLNVTSGVLHVAPGDVFTLAILQASDSNTITLVGGSGGGATWLGLEVIE